MQINLKSLIVQIAGVFTIFALALFIPAGTIAWPAGWIFLTLFFGFALSIFSWLYPHNPGLLRERMRLGTSDQQAWDKLLFPLIQAYLLIWLVFMSLDAARFHWSSVPIWLQGAGAILIFIVGTSLLLGSAYGVLVGLLGMFMLARRAVLEEHTLSKELPDYAAYKEKVRYRLIPLIW